jgi:hypothetical protein
MRKWEVCEKNGRFLFLGLLEGLQDFHVISLCLGAVSNFEARNLEELLTAVLCDKQTNNHSNGECLRCSFVIAGCSCWKQQTKARVTGIMQL